MDTSSAVVQNDGSTVPLTTGDLLQIQDLDPHGEPTELTLSSGRYRLAASSTMTGQGGMVVAVLYKADSESSFSYQGTEQATFEAKLADWVDVASLATYCATQNLLANSDEMAGPARITT